MSEGTELVVRASADIKKVELIQEILRGNKSVSDLPKNDVDAATVQKDMFERALAAEDDDELENLGTSIPWQTLEGIPVQIIGFDAVASEQKDGPPVFAVVDVQRGDTGDYVTVSNGSWGVWAVLLNLAMRGLIPGAVRVLEIGKETKSGGKPQTLVRTKSEQDEARAAKVKKNL